eukprot:TRINITY_DN7408_c0_g1_i1.p1 TRINITY_DN7408_c0_g1~~TRINITY_DN7408_c0_g1_i1.p1  ORF type:complete len:586 (+),score=153.81 TRINITY_DN7408_c0_g1_i1:42-1799(+)
MRDLGGLDDGGDGGREAGLTETPFGLTKVYVDYLPRSNDGLTDRLEAFFNCGKIIKLLKKQGKTNGYVIFKKPNSVRVALKKHDADFEGRRLRVEMPKGLVESGKDAADDVDVEQRSRKKTHWKDTQQSWDSLPQRQVYVNHLAKPVNEEILRQVVNELAPSVAGDLEGIKFMGARNSCFVTMKTSAQVQVLSSVLNGHALLGQTLIAVPAQAPGVLKGTAPSSTTPVRRNTKQVDAEDDEPTSDFEEVGQGKTKFPQRKNIAYEDDVQHTGPRRGNTVLTNPDEINTERQKQQAALGTCRTVLAGMFPDETRPHEIRTQFATAGRVLNVHMVRNKVTGAFTGVASVKFDTPKAVLNALDMDGKTVQIGRGVTLSVELDASEEELKAQREAKSKVVEKKLPQTPTLAKATAATTTARAPGKASANKKAMPLKARPAVALAAGDVDSDDDAVMLSDDEAVAASRVATPATTPAAPLTASKGKKKRKVPEPLEATADGDEDDVIVEMPARVPRASNGATLLASSTRKAATPPAAAADDDDDDALEELPARDAPAITPTGKRTSKAVAKSQGARRSAGTPAKRRRTAV